MKNFPLLSVIVSAYDTEQLVEKCIDSLLKQTYPAIEIIIVGNTSDRNITALVSEYQNKYEKIIYKGTESKSFIESRLIGLQASTGEYFTFVNGGDWVGVDLYRVMMAKALSADADIIATDRLEYIDDDSFYSPHDMLQQIDWDLHGKEILDTLMTQRGLDDGWGVAWNKIYARHLWEDTKAFLNEQENFPSTSGDEILSVAFFAKASHFVNVHHNHYYYNQKQNLLSQHSLDIDLYQKYLSDIQLSFSIGQKVLQNIVKESIYTHEWQQWKNNILERWEEKYKTDKNLKRHEIKQLEEYFKREIVNQEKEFCNKDRSFCTQGAWWHSVDLYEAIKEDIASDDCEVVSFDIFDTLICRPFFYPTDLFHLLDCYINEWVPSTDYLVFANIRQEAENCARKRKALVSPSWEEVTLDEIYAEVRRLCPNLSPYIKQIQEKEIELELKYCKVRHSGQELLECALACGKKAICTSDMYLPEKIVKKILEKNGLSGISQIYISSELGLTKASGNLFSHVLKKEGLDKGLKYMVHIGDNWISDVVNAQKQGIHSYHLPKATDLFSNLNSAIYSGSWYYHIFHEQKGFLSAHGAFETWGIRCMMAVAANRLFDNPFVIYNPDSDFNGDAYTIGYLALGMHIYSIADWLLHSVKEQQFQNLCFMARDGYLPYKAFDELNKIYSIPIKTHYLYLSRKAILPLMLINGDTDFYALWNTFNLSTLSPSKFLRIASPIIVPDKIKTAESICTSHHIPYKRSFGSIDSFLQFGQLFLKEFYSKERAENYKFKLSNYLSPMFEGKTATFDVGYNARCECILQRNFAFDITAHYIHTSNDRPFGRIEKSGIKLKSLYPYTPFITGIIREQLLSELTPSCIGYDDINGKFQPIFEDYECNLQTWFITHTLQMAALDFVKDMVACYGDDIKHLAYRFYDASIPLEYWFHYPKTVDQNIFKGTLFEDDMGMGNHKSLVDFWNRELNRWGAVDAVTIYQDKRIDYDSYSFFKRWAMIFANDWGEGKRRFQEKFRTTPIILHISRGIYGGLRKIYRVGQRKL